MPNLDAFKEIAKTLSKLPSREEFVAFGKKLIEAIAKKEQRLEQKIDSRLSQIRDGEPGRKGDPGEKGEPGRKGEPGEKGEPGRAADETRITEDVLRRVPPPPFIEPLAIRDKLESIEPEEDKLKIEAIRDLREELDELRKLGGKTVYMGGGGVGQGGGIVKAYDLSPLLDGVTRTYSLPAFWRVISVHLSSFPNILRPGIHYTTDAGASTITFTSEVPDVSLEAGQTLLVVYAEP